MGSPKKGIQICWILSITHCEKESSVKKCQTKTKTP